jgi:uncharacterized protein YndB with AHSA1/START domain
MPEVDRVVAAEPGAAWELLTRTRHWPSWGPSVTAVDPGDATIVAGMTGRVRTPVGLWVPFRITRVDPPHRWEWRVLGLPATTHRVEPVPAGCRVAFGVPLVAIPYLAVCRVALSRIATLLEQPAG